MRLAIAAALIDDGHGRILLVRKAGTPWFMQPGGKLEPGEAPLDALRRELAEELDLSFGDDAARPLGRFRAPAADEPGWTVDADLYHLRVEHPPVAAAEIAELRWVTLADAASLPLAPLTRDHVLPLARALLAGKG